MEKLTEGMKKALVAVAYGVRKNEDGYRSVETTKTVDGRSLEALYKRGLVSWKSTGGYRPFIELNLTEAGDDLFEEELRYADDG